MRFSSHHMRFVCAAFLIVVCYATATPAEVAVIANKSVPADTISQREVLDIYTGEIRSWKNGDPIVAHDMTEEGDVRETFYEFLGRKSSRVKSIWVKNLLMGEGSPPESVESEEELLARVAKTPGAIGFVRSDMTDDSVKVLAIISDSNGSK